MHYFFWGENNTKCNKGPSINYVAKRDRQTSRQNTIFTTKTDRPFVKIRRRQKIGISQIIVEFKRHFQSPFEEMNTDFSVVMYEFLYLNKNT